MHLRHLVEGIAGEAGAELAHVLTERGRVGVEVHEDEPLPHVRSDGHEPEVGLVQVEELVLNEAMDSFDVALEGVSRRRDALVLRAEVSDRARKVRAGAVGLELADEFAAVVGLPSHVTQGDAAARQVALDALGEPLAGLGRALGSVSQELQAAADLAGRVLDGG